MEISFRKVIASNDLNRVRQITLSTGFFRDDEIEVAVELATEALDKGQEQSGYFFLFSMMGDHTTGFVCFGPTPCTIGTFDLYWIVVDNNFRGNGTGKALMQQTERELIARKARKLYIETSSTDKYLPTRKFYENCGYAEEARLKDFYSNGDDKVIYSKVLISQ
ncbi:MAG: GNAT family N-acetyltransferase [Bacteroidales bacterium]